MAFLVIGVSLRFSEGCGPGAPRSYPKPKTKARLEEV